MKLFVLRWEKHVIPSGRLWQEGFWGSLCLEETLLLPELGSDMLKSGLSQQEAAGDRLQAVCLLAASVGEGRAQRGGSSSSRSGSLW